MTTKIGAKSFSGASNVHNGTLAAAIRGLAQREALTLAIALNDFTADNSNGTDGAGTVAAVAIPAAYTTAGTDLFPKAGGETAFGTVTNAIATVLEQANAVAAAIGADQATDSTGGTSGSGTIAAVTVATTAVTGASGNGMAATAGIAKMKEIAGYLTRLVRFTNTLCTAVGVAKLTDNSGGDGGTGIVFPAISADTGTATPDGLSSTGIADTAGEAFLQDCADVIATCAAKLDAITGATLGAPTVVAVD